MPSSPIGGTRRRARALAVLLMAAALLSPKRATAAPAADPIRVVIIKAAKRTKRGSLRKIRAVLRQAIQNNGRLALITLGHYLRVARTLRIPRRKRRRLRAIRRVGKRLDLHLVVRATLSRRGRGYRLTLKTVWSSLGKRSGPCVIELRRPVVTAAEASQLVEALVAGLPDFPSDPVTAEDTAPSSKQPSSRPTKENDKSKAGEDAAWGVASAEAWGSNGQDDGAAGGEEASDAASPAEPADDDQGASPIKVEGRIQVEHHSAFKNLGDDRINSRNSVDLALGANARVGWISAKGSLLVRRDFSTALRSRLEAEEAFIEARRGPLSVLAGRKEVSWGTASLLNPTDVINTQDLRDPLDPEKLGSWMIRAAVILGPIQVAGFFLPVPEVNLLPLPTGYAADGSPRGPWRWHPDSLAAPGGLPLEVTLADTGLPTPSLRRSQLALRAAASFTGVDISVGYVSRYDPFVSLRTAQRPVPPQGPTAVAVDLILEYHRLHLLTLDLELVLGKLRLAAEALGVLTEDMDATDPAITDPYVSGVVGGDYRSSQFWDDHRLHMFLEVLVNRPLAGELAADPLGLIRTPFEAAALARLRYEVGEDIHLDINLISSLLRFDLLINPSVEVVMLDNVTLEVGVMILLGDEEGFFGRYRDNSRFNALVEFAF